MSRPAIVFIGFMGAGKSTALAAAREAGLETVEVDDLMEAALGRPIARPSRSDGEEAFRAREAEVVGELLENADGGAIALGGGSVLSDGCARRSPATPSSWLQIDAAEAWRADRGHRAAAGDQRRPTSSGCWRSGCRSTRSWPTRWCRWPTSAIVARALPAIQALAEMPAGTRLLWASSASGEYPVFVGRGLLDAGLVAAARGAASASPTATVAALYAERLAPLAATVSTSSPGEAAKTLAEAERVLERAGRARA